MNYLKPELLIIIPLLIGIGQLVKQKVDSKWVPYIILPIGILISIGYGFIISNKTGWQYYVDAVLIIGVVHGMVASFCSMGLYSTVKTALKGV